MLSLPIVGIGSNKFSLLLASHQWFSTGVPRVRVYCYCLKVASLSKTKKKYGPRATSGPRRAISYLEITLFDCK